MIIIIGDTFKIKLEFWKCWFLRTVPKIRPSLLKNRISGLPLVCMASLKDTFVSYNFVFYYSLPKNVALLLTRVFTKFWNRLYCWSWRPILPAKIMMYTVDGDCHQLPATFDNPYWLQCYLNFKSGCPSRFTSYPRQGSF